MKAFGRLEPTRPIGRGGAGEVWEAIWHGPQGFQKLVAIKHLPRAVTSQTAQQELIREARVGALLSHPNLVDTLDLVQHDGRWTLVMALVRGAPLSKLARGPWFPARVVEVGLMVCAGLTHVHGYCDAAGRPLGLVHRDIKLENLLVDIHGLVRIADLGIASWRDSASEPAGTPGYIAPEQLNGAPEARSDLFSLGVTLARLATGEAPFGRGSSAIAALADTDRVALDPALFATLEGVAPGLGEVIRRALRHDPALRWPSAEAMAGALRAVAARCPPAPTLATLVKRHIGPSSSDPTEASAPSLRGREREQKALEHLLADGHRWVTLQGPAGSGTSALLQQLAVSTRGALLVDGSAALVDHVAEALRVPSGGDAAARVALVLAARGTRLLCVDDLRPPVDDATAVLASWLDAAPSLQIVCASTEALPASTVLKVGPLPRASAVAMLEDHLDRPIPPDEALRVVDACDRLPLAIQLAAGRLRDGVWTDVTADTPWIGDELARSVRVALRALDATDRRALAMLASFVGSFDVRAATAVLDDEAESGASPIERLARLTLRSVVESKRGRFRLLRAVRGAVITEAAPEALEVGRARHADWFAQLGTEEALNRRTRAGHRSYRAELAAAASDLDAALNAALAQRRPTVAQALAAALMEQHIGAERYSDALEVVARLRSLREPTDHHVLLRWAEALLQSGDARVALALLDDALERAAEPARWVLLERRAHTALYARRDEARSLADVEVALGALTDAHHPHALSAQTLYGIALARVGRISEAIGALERASQLALRWGAPTANIDNALGVVLGEAGGFAEAFEAFGRAIDAAGDGQRGSVWARMNVVAFAARLGEPDAIAQLLREAEARERDGDVVLAHASHLLAVLDAAAKGDRVTAEQSWRACSRLQAHLPAAPPLVAFAEATMATLRGEPDAQTRWLEAWASRDRLEIFGRAMLTWRVAQLGLADVREDAERFATSSNALVRVIGGLTCAWCGFPSDAESAKRRLAETDADIEALGLRATAQVCVLRRSLDARQQEF